jgi:hypothetical protein
MRLSCAASAVVVGGLAVMTADLWLAVPVSAQKTPNGGAAPGKQTGSATQAGSATAGAGQATKEKFKSGLWAIHVVTTTSAGGQGSESDSAVCRDQSYDMAKIWQLMTKDAAQDGCTMNSTTPETGKMVVTMQCNQQAMHSTGKMTMAQVDEEHMHVDMQMSLSGSAGGRSVSNEVKITEDLTYKGPCPANMAPGDQRDADGTISHAQP